MKKIDARDMPCPKPIIMAKLSLEEDPQVELVVNEEAIADLKLMANKLGGEYKETELQPDEYQVSIKLDDVAEKDATSPENFDKTNSKGGLVIMVGNKVMGTGPEELGTILINGMIYTLNETDPLPKSVIFYNNGIHLTTTDNDALEDIKRLESMGVEILSCGTCLNFHNVEDQVRVGGVTNMYEIFQRLGKASQVITLE